MNLPQPTEQHIQGHSPFQARQWSAKAEVNAEAECDMRIRRPMNIEAIGIWED